MQQFGMPPQGGAPRGRGGFGGRGGGFRGGRGTFVLRSANISMAKIGLFV